MVERRLAEGLLPRAFLTPPSSAPISGPAHSEWPGSDPASLPGAAVESSTPSISPRMLAGEDHTLRPPRRKTLGALFVSSVRGAGKEGSAAPQTHGMLPLTRELLLMQGTFAEHLLLGGHGACEDKETAVVLAFMEFVVI